MPNGAGVAASPIHAVPSCCGLPFRGASPPGSRRLVTRPVAWQRKGAAGKQERSAQLVAVMRSRAPEGAAGTSFGVMARSLYPSALRLQIRASRCSSHRTRLGFGRRRSPAFPLPSLYLPSAHRCRWRPRHPGRRSTGRGNRFRSATSAFAAIRPAAHGPVRRGLGDGRSWPRSQDPFRRPPPGGSVTGGKAGLPGSADRRRSLRMGLRPAVSLVGLSCRPSRPAPSHRQHLRFAVPTAGKTSFPAKFTACFPILPEQRYRFGCLQFNFEKQRFLSGSSPYFCSLPMT